MKCKHCGLEIDNDSNFCEFCGGEVENGARKLWLKYKWVVILTSSAVALGLSLIVINNMILNTSSVETPNAEILNVDTVGCFKMERPALTESERQALIEMGYVDLGLPSGTLWKDRNEKGYYAFEEAIEKFDNLPSRADMEELMSCCKWTWSGWRTNNRHYIVTGPNGNSIILPVNGYCISIGQKYGDGQAGYYIVKTSEDKPNDPYCLMIYREYNDNNKLEKDLIGLGSFSGENSYSVRLCR